MASGVCYLLKMNRLINNKVIRTIIFEKVKEIHSSILLYKNTKSGREIEETQSIRVYLEYKYNDTKKINEMYDSVKHIMGTNQYNILHYALNYNNMEFARRVYTYLMDHTSGPIARNQSIHSIDLDTIEKLDIIVNLCPRFSTDINLLVIIQIALKSAWLQNNTDFATSIIKHHVCNLGPSELNDGPNGVKVVFKESRGFQPNQSTSLELVKLFKETNGLVGSWKSTLKKATILNRIDIVEYLLPTIPLDQQLYLIDDAKTLEMIHTILVCKPNESIYLALVNICSIGNIEMYQYLSSRFISVGDSPPSPDLTILGIALINGHMEMAQYILDNVSCPYPNFFVVDDLHIDLISIGTINLLLNHPNVTFRFTTLYCRAVQNGLLNIVQYLDSKMTLTIEDSQFSDYPQFHHIDFGNALSIAMTRQDLEMVQFILSNHSDHTGYQCKLLFTQSPESPKEIIEAIASSSILFLSSRQIFHMTLYTLVDLKYYSTIKILIEYNRIEKVIDSVIEKICLDDNLEIIKVFANFKNSQSKTLSTRSIENLISKGHLNVLEYFKDQVCKFSNAVKFACQFGNVKVLEWLMENAKLSNQNNQYFQTNLTPTKLHVFLKTNSTNNSPDLFKGKLVRSAFEKNQLAMIQHLYQQYGETLNCNLKSNSFSGFVYKHITSKTLGYLIENNLIIGTVENCIGILERTTSIKYLELVIQFFNLYYDKVNNLEFNIQFEFLGESICSHENDLVIMAFDFFNQINQFQFPNNIERLKQFQNQSIQNGNIPLLKYLNQILKDK
ncbi:hypothetical protein DFA_07760 [Cavenderia fasciculata]|uniref:Ankyrin repeat-containing protein n=1 Tax=Cavenderia fasciculata TaxID=261658 RepID=F4Q360_CACFS|nr:uncharacterized protein DFA_07760 [Cavenderia fasciculata]EGG16782.1 hypothetical protein DFA_07760 [Cavenderia fasciculata]|eukprot:XP_004355256.1 hypothetical protein DFA_07760 [Cavenderia fasciculata]